MDDIGFGGTASRFNTRFGSGSEITAKQLNDLANGIQTTTPMPYLGAGQSVSFVPGGALITQIPRATEFEGIRQQFEIFVEPYQILGVDTGLSIIRVVKGEVVWSPKLTQLPPPAPAVISCTTQTTIENWFALPTFPIIDDENAVFIGDGGVRVPKVAGVPVGIFIFKATNLSVDLDPIIVAVPDYVPTCPVVFPGAPPVAGAFWEVVKIGSVIYVEPDPEADPPVSGGWEITQNFIGSMTLPSAGSSSNNNNNKPFPPQLPSNAIPKARPMPFECRIDVDSGGDMLLRIGNGTVSYTKSNMPWVGIGATVNNFQVRYGQLQVVPSGWRKVGSLNADLAWMELGGGYKITGAGQWYLVACYWDALESAGEGNFTLPTPLKSGVPFLALIDAYGGDVEKLFVETGPGLYTNTMNIQRMSGYTSTDTGKDWDWGHCHTTYFNPMKLGYDIKIIATIESSPASASVPQIFTYQSATSSRNEIQNIYFPVIPKDGFVVFTYDEIPSLPFYPSPWSGANDATNLFDALQAIPDLLGNVTVTRTSEKNFYITFINNLQSTDVPLLAVGVNGLQSWEYEYSIDQHHIGNLVLDAGPRFDGTQIMNKPNVTQSQDPYVIQSNNNPSFNEIINRSDVMACNNFSGDTNFTAGITPIVNNGSPESVTQRQWTYGKANGCSDAVCDHPLQFRINQDGSWTVCPGTINNVEVVNLSGNNGGATGGAYIYVRCGNQMDGTEVVYPSISGDGVPRILWSSDIQSDSDDYGYILIATVDITSSGGTTTYTVNQMVQGSLWSERHKFTAPDTASYYFYRI